LKPSILKLFLALCLVTLSACETQPSKDVAEKDLPIVTKKITPQQASLSEEAEQQLSLAEDSDTLKDELSYRLQATRLYIEANEIELAKHQLNIIRSRQSEMLQPDEIQSTDILLVSAKISIAEKNIPLANQIVSEITPVNREQQIEFHALKADLDYISGRYFFTIDRRIQLATYLVNKKDIKRNNEKIWAALSNMTSTQLHNQYTNKPVFKGWLELAEVMRKGQRDISKLEDDLLDWGTKHPEHPAIDSFLAELIDDYQDNLSSKKVIAVLLPMQGKLSKISASLKNGILSAYYKDANSPIKPVIKFYDSSNEELSFQELYRQAIDEGATNIIGPVDKVVINQLTQQQELDIPVLTLNYSEKVLYTTENLFQFGLSPEDEARQVAELAINQNKYNAAIFYPDSEWGKRLKNAFTEHFESLGGKVLTTADYVTTTNDYRRPIRAMLNLDQSSIRHRKIEGIIGQKTQSEAYPRQDVDLIFLAATHRSARSIMPAFKFHHAADIPVYSTSHVYTGKTDRELDRDLDGLIFCDLPWILKNNSDLLNTFEKNWPQHQQFTRLFALGVDAYHLLYNLEYLKNRDYAFYDGQTGNIQLDESNRITRKSLWAKFVKGRAITFEPEQAAPTPLTRQNTNNSQNASSD
jgi:outer membrane PBP1 activator LpoA protein